MSDAIDNDRVFPKGAPVQSAEEGNGRKSPATRRVRVNNNLISTVFSPEPVSDAKTIRRCTYNKNVNSHEDIFGQTVAGLDHTTVRCGIMPTSNTQQNLFGGSGQTPPPVPSMRMTSSTHEDTFDSLFGVPEITTNTRRPYEEDTHCKLFGEPDPVHRLSQVPPENTQANLFGPPTTSTTHVTSRSEDTQLDLFGPPLPSKSPTKKVVRSGLQLFTDAVEPLKPVVQTRGAKTSATSYEALFGPPPPHRWISRRPPEENTALRLFGPTIKRPLRSLDTKPNPITGEQRTETPSTLRPAPPTSTAISPITGLTLAGSKGLPEEKVSRGKRQLPGHSTTVNTITGARLNYTDGEAMQVEENKKETTENLSSQTKKAEKSLDREDSTGQRFEQQEQRSADSTSSSFKRDSDTDKSM